jgi:hypothetical protein
LCVWEWWLGRMKSLLGIAGHWRCCLYSVGRRQVSRRAGAGLQVGAVTLTSGHGGAVDETSRGEAMLLSLARGPR